MYKDDLLRIPLFGRVLHGLEMISLDGRSLRQAHDALTVVSAKKLAEGRVVVIFPEGTRVNHGVPVRVSSGGSRLVCATGTDVVPIVHDAGRVWPAKGWRSGPGSIRVIIGAPISPVGCSQQEVTRTVNEWMQVTYLELTGRSQ